MKQKILISILKAILIANYSKLNKNYATQTPEYINN